MTISDYTLTLDVHRVSSQAALNMKQGETDRRIIVHLAESGVPIAIDSGSYAVFAGKKPDGKVLWNPCEIKDNTIYYDLTQQTTAAIGIADCQIRLYSAGGKLICSPDFTIIVDENPVPDAELVESVDEVNALTILVTDATALINEVQRKLEAGEFVGPQGEQGPQGIQGEKGEKGEKGDKGDKGDPGDSGSLPIVCGVSGSVVAVSDASERSLENLVLYGKTTQNGTPTPEAPIELVSAGADGDIAVTVAGKNLFDPERLLQTAGNCVYDEATGLWTTGLSGGYNRSVFSDVAGVSSDRDIKYLLPLSENTTYTIKLFDYATASTVSSLLRVNFHDKDGVHLGQKSFDEIATFTTPAGTRYVDFCRGHNAGNFSFSKIQLEVGSVATAYEAYKAQTITIPTENGLPGIPVSSGGNYTDENGQQWVCDYKDYAKCVYVQHIKELIFTGTENLVAYGTVTNGIRFSPPIADYVHQDYTPNNYCSHFVRNAYAFKNQENLTYKIHNPNYVVFRHDDYPTVDTFKAWLAEQYSAGTPVKVQYILETPIETPLSAEEIEAYSALHTNKPNTTVFNDSGAGQKVAYVADTKAYIDQKIAAISAAVLNA